MVARDSKEAYASGLANLAAALANWAASRAGTRRGPKIAFPKFKGKRSVLSVRFTTGAFGLPDQDRRHVRLPRIGLVRTHESTRKLARRVDAGTARIRSVTVSLPEGPLARVVQCRGRPRRPEPGPARGHRGCGCGDQAPGGAVLRPGHPDPRPLDKAQRDLRRLARQASRRAGPDRRTGRQPSRRWRKTQAKLARRHARAANLRDNALHQLTTRLASAYGTVVVEDLHVAGMLRNRRLARHLADVGFGSDPPPARLQDRVARRAAGDRRPVLPVLEDLLGLRRNESQAAPVRADVPVRAVRPGHGPGSPRRP